MSNTLRRLFFNSVPFGAMAIVVCMAIFGDHGLIRRHYLKTQDAAVQEKIAEMEKRNSELRRQLRILDTRLVGVQRLAAEEMMMAPEGSTIYHFQTDLD